MDQHFDTIAANVRKLNQNVGQMAKVVNELGTRKDGKTLREDLKQLREQTQDIVLQTKQLLKKQYAPQDKAKHSRLTKQFNDILVEYEKIAQASLKKEREVVALLEEARSRGHTLKEQNNNPVDIGLQLQDVLKEIPIENVDDEIINEQNKDIKQIEKDLEFLTECFTDIAKEVKSQGEALTVVETNVERSVIATEQGMQDLIKASILQASYRKKTCCVVLLLSVLAGIIIGFYFLSHGFGTCEDNNNCDNPLKSKVDRLPTIPVSMASINHAFNSSNLKGKSNDQLLVTKDKLRFFTSRRVWVDKDNGALVFTCFLPDDVGNYTIRDSVDLLVEFSVWFSDSATIPSNTSLFINGSLADIKSGQAFPSQPMLELTDVNSFEDIDYILTVPKGFSARAYWTAPTNTDDNSTLDFDDLTVIGGDGTYRLYFIDKQNCAVSSNSKSFKVTVDDGGVVITVIAYFGGAIVLLFLFAVANYYIRNREASDLENKETDSTDARQKKTFLQFAKTIPFKDFFWYPTEQIIRKKGSSLYPFFQFIFIGAMYFGFLSFLGIILLVISVPGNSQLHSFSASTFDNWQNDSPMLWLYNVFGLIVFALALHVYVYLSTVQRTFEKERKSVAHKTVMITGVPNHIVDASVYKAHFNEIYPGQLIALHIVWDVSEKFKEITKDNKLVALESLKSNNDEVTVNSSIPLNVGIIFVTFASAETAAKCVEDYRLTPPKSTISERKGNDDIRTSDWQVEQAPEARDIIWMNMQNPRGLAQKIGQNVLFVLSTIVIVLLVLASVAIAQFRSIFGLLHDTPLAAATATASLPGFQVIPPIALIVLKTLIPIIINAVESRTPYHLYSTMKRRILKRSYYAQIFLIIVLPSLVFGIFAELYIRWVCVDLDKYDSACVYRGATDMFFSVMGPIFTTFIIGDLFLGTALDIVKLPELAKRLLAAKKGKPFTPDAYIFDSPTQYTQYLLMLTIAMVFSVMVPVLVIVAFLYFLVKYYNQKYNMIYRAEKILFSDGHLIKTVKRSLWMSITLYSCFMLAFFVKKGSLQLQYFWWILTTIFMLIRYLANINKKVKHWYHPFEHGFTFFRPGGSNPFDDWVSTEEEVKAYRPKFVVHVDNV